MSVCCPKCGSSNTHADKKGFSFKKSLAGGLLAGPVGLLGGTIGSNKIRITCLDCGYVFKPGEKATPNPMDYYKPTLSGADIQQKTKAFKSNSGQRVKIETLLKYRDVINDGKVSLLEAMKAEGETFVIVPNGEIDELSKLRRSNSTVKRIVSFQSET